MNYAQSQDELLNSYEFILYDVQKAQLSTSKVKYAASGAVSYTFEGLADNTTYFVRCIGQTIGGTILDTGYVGISVKYSSPNVFSGVELYNNCKGGYVTITSNLTNIVGSSIPVDPEQIYVTGGGVDLTNSNYSVQWSTGYNLQGDFTASVWGYSLNNNSTILTMQDEDGGWIKVDVYTDKDDEDKSYAVLTDDDGAMVFSELIDTPWETDEIQIWVRRNNGIYDVKYVDLTEHSFIMFSSDSSFTLATYNSTKNWDGTLEYSTDTTTWSTWDGTTTLSSSNNVLYLRGSDNTYITGNSLSYRWVLTNSNNNGIRCIGNIENLLDYQDVLDGNHPTMANYCYGSIFYNCTSLTIAPSLPATTLAGSCYYRMFEGCTSLTTTPLLSATTLANSCYYRMFSGCTSLSIAPTLSSTSLAEACYFHMFSGCTSLILPPSLPATTLTVQCYYYMFQGCTSLTTLPKLAGTNILNYCYESMFEDCSSIKVSATQTSEYQYEWRLPYSGTATSSGYYWNRDMLDGTGGTFTSDPTIETTYYTNNPPV